MQNEGLVSVGTVPDRPYLIGIKTWLEGARDMLIPAIQRAENELQRIGQIESAFSDTDAPSSVMERLTGIRAGIEECLEILRDQDREWINRINSVENLGRISEAGEDSGELSDRGYLGELKGWLEGARDMLIPAVQRAENELQRIRQIESVFYKTEALSPVTGRLTKIREGMEECLEILHDLNVEWISRITWIENPAKITAVWEVHTELPERENLVEVQAEVPSKLLISDVGVVPFPYEEQAGIDKKNSMTAARSKTFSNRHLLTFLFFLLATVLITASFSYLITNQSNRIADLHNYISTLKNELSTSHSDNNKLAIKNTDLNHHMADMEVRSDDLKDKNNELQLALQAANSSLAQSKYDSDVTQAANLKMISEVKSKLLKFAGTQTQLEGLRYLSEISKSESGRSLILNPVWFKSGESAQVLHGRLTIRVEQASGQNSRSDAIVQLSSTRPGFANKPFNKTLCPRLGIPDNFRFKYHRCSLVLLGSKTNNDGTKAYMIAILKTWAIRPKWRHLK